MFSIPILINTICKFICIGNKKAAGSLPDCEVLCIIVVRRAFLSSSLQEMSLCTLFSLFQRFQHDKGTKNWLLRPITESNLQLFALVSIWLSSKIHDTTPLSVGALKLFGDEFIKEQHYTKRDLLDAVLKFEIGTSHLAFIMVEELLSQLKVVARVGEHVNFEVCMDVLDLLYEKEATSLLYNSPCFLAASILVVVYVISAPSQRLEFPILPWGKIPKIVHNINITSISENMWFAEFFKTNISLSQHNPVVNYHQPFLVKNYHQHDLNTQVKSGKRICYSQFEVPN
ncbi:cyclin-J18 isoform X2 [Henckelia pumila]|uniref:cyclin-J18 isoform X2 n=1 Tax=Henckelia pumila TaxID=405737 RepID=UPI003C6DD734